MFALGPILAQAINLGLGDRTEVRARFDQYSGTAEAATSPFVSLSIADTRRVLTLRYGPSLTLTTLDGRTDRQLLVNHMAQAIGTLRLRPATLTLSETANYGERNFLVDAFAGGAQNPAPAAGPSTGTQMPNPGPGTNTSTNTGTGTTGNPQVIAYRGRTVRYGDLTSQLTLTQPLSRKSTFGTYARYLIAGGVDDDSRQLYPVIRSTQLGAFYGYTVSRRTALGSFVSATYTTGDNGVRSYSADFTEGFKHSFTSKISLALALGLGYARVEYPNGDVLEFFYLTAGGGTGIGLGVEYVAKVYGGILTLYARVGYSLALDRVDAVLNPRITLGTGATWVRRRTTLYANLASSISLRPDLPGATDAIIATLGANYKFEGGFSGDLGARAVYQTYQGDQSIPPTYGLFAALTWGAVVPLAGGR